MSKPLIVTIEKPFTHIVFEPDLQTATVTMFGRTFYDLPVKRRWLGESDYLYTIIVPIAKLPEKRYMLAISNDAVFNRVHSERQPFPDLKDEPDFNPRDKVSKKKKSEQLPLFGEGE